MYIDDRLRIQVSTKLYVKDPVTSDLGRKIVVHSIELMEATGYEAFTFRKLAAAIESTEASVYRYFESKQQLLQYLCSWYWAWMDYRVIMATANIASPTDRLMRAVSVITGAVGEDVISSQINEAKLQRIVIREASKAYLCKEVDEANSHGAYANYKLLVQRLSGIVLEINPAYKYPHMLVSTIVEGAHHERFFAEHLPRLTDQWQGEDSISTFYLDLVQRAISHD